MFEETTFKVNAAMAVTNLKKEMNNKNIYFVHKENQLRVNILILLPALTC
jgi:hypothetical protein